MEFKPRSSSSGQVAVIMIVVIAIGLILFAATVNMTMVSQAKTLTMKAAAASASTSASVIASYGQQQFMTTLGGERKKCKKSSGGLIAIITLVVLIVIAIYAGPIAGYFGAGSSTAAGTVGGALQAAATTAAIMQGAAVVVMATTDPGISEAWNKMMAERLSQTGQFLERGIQSGLQVAVTDSVTIPDLYDFNQDGKFGLDAANVPRDEISRFALYNTKRYLELTGPNTDAVEEFINALHELVVKGGDGWGLWDPVFYPDHETRANPADGVGPVSGTHPCYDADFDRRPAECDPCCVQSSDVPAGCLPGPDQIGNRLSCANRTPFRAAGNVYQYLYDPYYEDSTNAFMSFRELLGRDDEHRLYHTQTNPNGVTGPNWHHDPISQPQILQSSMVPADPSGFYLKDVVGYDISPTFSAPNDVWVSASAPKLFPFLYKMRDWGPDLGTLTYANYQCHWCDGDKPTEPGRTCPYDLSPEIGRLAFSGSPLTHSGGWCVDTANTNPAAFPIKLDKVPGIDGLYVADNVCAINHSPAPVHDPRSYVGGWKRGSDRFCSNLANTAYDVHCSKHGAVSDDDQNAQCGEAGAASPENWPDDMLDEIIYGLPKLFALETELWKAKDADGGLEFLTQNLEEWYNEVAEWIEPGCADPANCPGSFTKQARPGYLYRWREQLVHIRDLINNWLLPPPGSAYQSSSCYGTADSAWCVQTSNCGGSIPPAELATFNVNGNSITGDVQDVLACLNWNANDLRTYLAAPPATGNAEKFARCRDFCSQNTCSNLPRSLVPGFYDPPYWPMQFLPPAHETAFTQCLASNTIAQCDARCNNTTLPSGSPYNLPVFDGPQNNEILTIDNWCALASPNRDNYLDNACNPARMISGAHRLWCDGNTTNPAGANQQACRCSWADDCAAIASECSARCGVTITCSTAYRDEVADAVTESRGSCGDVNWDPPGPATGLRDLLDQSAREAEIQVAKLRHRYIFLNGRYQEATAIVGVLNTAIDKITAFLDGGNNYATAVNSPAERFIQARSEGLDDMLNDLPPFSIYVWQDRDAQSLNLAGQPRHGTGQGYWHAVKSEARIPRRCDNDCIARDLPKIHSSTSGGFLSKKVCYELINLRGMTKARVIRYDQDKDLRGLVFPGQGQIWGARLGNPLAPGDPDPTGLRSVCQDLFDPDLADWLAGVNGVELSKIGAAFMLNKIPNLAAQGQPTPEGRYADCWVKVHNAMLAHGVMSEACAEYYFVEGEGFRIKFVECDDW